MELQDICELYKIAKPEDAYELNKDYLELDLMAKPDYEQEIGNPSVICAWFICDLPFDC